MFHNLKYQSISDTKFHSKNKDPIIREFFDSERGVEARKALLRLTKDIGFNTDSTRYYNGTQEDFIDRHLRYLSTHPKVNLFGYISNLKSMTRNRSN